MDSRNDKMTGVQRIVLENRPDLGEGKKLVKIRPEKPKYKVILSIDGGGVRSIIPAIVLGKFEEIVKEEASKLHQEPVENLVVDIKSCFDVLAGTSAGSILALYLASGGGRDEIYKTGGLLEGIRPGSAKGAITVVSETVKKIFATPFFKKIPGIRDLIRIFSAIYDSSRLESAMNKIFGDAMLEDLLINTHVAAYELNRDTPVGFCCDRRCSEGRGIALYAYSKNTPTPSEPLHSSERSKKMSRGTDLQEMQVPFNLPLKVVALASSSAPVYFPSMKYARRDLSKLIGIEGEAVSWVDGGVVSNDPMLHVLRFTSNIFATEGQPLPLKDIALLSLGVGGRKRPSRTSSGLLWWHSELVSIIRDQHVRVEHDLVHRLLNHQNDNKGTNCKRYLLVDKIVGPDENYYDTLGTLDSVEELSKLQEFGEKLAIEYEEMLREFVRTILLA